MPHGNRRFVKTALDTQILQGFNTTNMTEVVTELISVLLLLKFIYRQRRKMKSNHILISSEKFQNKRNGIKDAELSGIM